MWFKEGKKSKCLLALLSSLSSYSAFSDGILVNPVPVYPVVFTLSGGAAWPTDIKSQTFYLAPGIEKTFRSNQVNAIEQGEFFIGMQRQLTQILRGQLGVAGAMTYNAKLSGDIWDDADPLFNNHLYHYRIDHTHAAIKGKLLADMGYIIIPWIDGSLGVGFNYAHGYRSRPKIFPAVQLPPFTNNTETAFTYTIGAGFQGVLSKHWQLGIGYQFADWGKNNLGRAIGQTMNTGLSMDHLYTNGVMVNVTYVV